MKIYLLILACLLFTGCTVESGHITAAMKMCKSNDGLDNLRWSAGPKLIAKCKNGAQFFIED